MYTQQPIANSDELALLIKKDEPHISHVPAGTVALVPIAPSPICLPAGRAISFSPPLMIANQQPCRFSFLVTGLLSQEGLALNLSLTLVIHLDSSDSDRLEACWRYFAAKYSHVASESIFETLYPPLCRALQEIIPGYAIEELLTGDIRNRCYPLLIEKLSEYLGQTGLTILKIAALAVDCPDYQKILEQRCQNAVQEKQLQLQEQSVGIRQRLLAGQEKDRREQMLSQHKLEQFATSLARQKYWQELDWQLALEQARFKHEMELAHRRARQLAETDLPTLIALIDDAALRADLYKALIEQQMSPEQLKAKVPASEKPACPKPSKEDEKQPADDIENADAVEHLAVASQAMSSKADIETYQPGKTQVQTGETPVSHSSNANTDKTETPLLLALSNGVVQFLPTSDPGQGQRLWESYPGYRFYSLPGQKLGGVRSVRPVNIWGRRYLGVGAIAGVYLISDDGSLPALSIAAVSRGKHGVNALGVVGDSLYASHSDHGLVVWQLDRMRRPARSYRPWRSSGKTTRALTIDGKTIYLAVDNVIYAIDSQQPDAAPGTSYQGSTGEITAIVITRDRVYASNAAGQLLCWSRQHPDRVACLWQSSNPIYMLRSTVIDNQWHLLLGCQEYGVVAFSPSQGTHVVYCADSHIRWVAGIKHLVAGVSRDMRRLYLWPDAQRHPAIIATVATIKDIFTADRQLQ